ncbi:unnamed protein product, partial [Mesorhabditis spiculigera]
MLAHTSKIRDDLELDVLELKLHWCVRAHSYIDAYRTGRIYENPTPAPWAINDPRRRTFKRNCTDGTDACKKRKRNYAKNLKRLKQLNETTHGDYEVEENKFMDWSDDELKQVGAVRNQGSCGSCWAFATSAAVETQMNYKNNRTGAIRRAYPEQYLVDCATNNYGCGGGWPSAAMEYIREYGTPRGAAYPYAGKVTKCKAGLTLEKPISSVTDLTGNVAAAMNFITNNGPITACFFVCNGFYSYKSGIYTTDCTPSSPGFLGGHAVAIIGYGTNAAGINYWLVRNSWGADWGLGGYFMIERGADIAGFETWELMGPTTVLLP